MTRIVLTPNPLRPHLRDVRTVSASGSVRDAIPPECDGWRVFVNGRAVGSAEASLMPVRDGDWISSMPAVTDPATIAINLLVSAIVSYASYRLFVDKPPPQRGDSTSPTYAWDGIGNNRADGQPRPVIYGRVRTGGTIIGEYIRAGSENSTLHLLRALSEGPIHGVGIAEPLGSTTPGTELEGGQLPTGVLFEGNSAENLRGVGIQIRVGTVQQESIVGFAVTRTEHLVALTLNSRTTTGTDNFVTWMTDPADIAFNADWDLYGSTVDVTDLADQFVARVRFPGGLAVFGSGGNLQAAGFRIAVRYRELDGSNNPIVTGGPQGDGWVRLPLGPVISESTRNSFEREFPFDLFDPQTFATGTVGSVGALDPSGSVDDYFSSAKSTQHPYGVDAAGAGNSPTRLSVGWRGKLKTFPAGATKQYALSTLESSGDQYGWALYAEKKVWPGGTVARWSWALEIRFVDGGTQVVVLEPASDAQAQDVLADTFYDVTFTFDGTLTTEDLRLYVNGALYLSQAGGPGPSLGLLIPFGDHTDMRCCHSAHDAANFSDMEVDEAYIFEGLNSAAGVAIMWTTKDPAIDSLTIAFLRAYWRFDSNSAVLPDYASANEIVGSWYGAMNLTRDGGVGTVGTDAGVITSGITGTPKRSKYRIQAMRVNLDSTHNQVNDQAELVAIQAILDIGFRHPSLAIQADRIQASEQLSTTKPTVTSVVWGRTCPIWESADSEPVQAFTQNPAWQSLEVVLNRRYGLGDRYSLADIDFDSWKTWADYCDDVVYDGSPRIGPTYNADSWANIYYDATATDAAGTVRGAIYFGWNVNKTVPDNYKVGKFVRAFGVPSGGGGFVDIQNSSLFSNHPIGGYEIAEVGFNVENVFAFWGVKCWWDRLTEGHPMTSGSDLATEISPTAVTGETTTGEPRHRFNGVFDTLGGNAWDALIAIMAAGRAVPAKVGRQLRAVADMPRTPVGMVGMGSIIEGTFRMEYVGPKARKNAYSVEFRDEDLDFDSVPEEIKDPEIQNASSADALRRGQFSTFGVTSRSQVVRQGLFQIKANKARIRRGSFRMGPEALHFLPGDIVYLSHDIVPRGVSGRILAISPTYPNSRTRFAIDRTFVHDGASVYVVRVHNRFTDEIEEATLSTPSPGVETTYEYGFPVTVSGGPDTASGGFTFDLEVRDVTWAIVKVGSELEVEIRNIRLGEDLESTVEFLEYDSSTYEDGITEQLNFPAPFSAETGFTDKPDSEVPVGPHALTVRESHARMSGDSYQPRAELSWTWAEADIARVQGVNILIRRSASGLADGNASPVDGWSIVRTFNGVPTSAVVPIESAERGDVFELAVQPFTYTGAKKDAGICPSTRFEYRAIGPAPGAIPSAVMLYQGNRAVYFWRVPVGSERAQVEVRRGGWILGQRVHRSLPGEVQSEPTHDWSENLNGSTSLLYAAVSPMGQFGAVFAETPVQSPFVETLAFPLEYASQAWEIYEDGWVEDAAPDAWEPVLSNLQRHADGYLEFSGSELLATYTTADESDASYAGTQSGRHAVRDYEAFLEYHVTAEQVHPLTWDEMDFQWNDETGQSWSWEGPTSNGIYALDNADVSVSFRLQNDGGAWGPWVVFRPGFYSFTNVQFRLTVTRASADFQVKVHGFSTRIRAKARTAMDRDRVTAYIERDIFTG